MSSLREKSFKLLELRNILKNKGLSAKGTEAELVNRLDNADPEGEWLQTRDETAMDDVNNDVQPSDARKAQYGNQEEVRVSTQREIELFRREKELAERELDLVRCELELLRMQRRDEVPHVSRATGWDNQDNVINVLGAVPQTKVNVTVVADLLCEFNGRTEDFET